MKRNRKFAYLLLLPCALIMLGSVFLPILTTFGYSLRDFNLTEPYNQKFIGFDNYQAVLGSKDFHSALFNSLAVLVMVLVIGLLLSMLIAFALNKKTKITPILTAIVIVPWALPPIVNGIMWKFIFFPGYGLMNKLLINIGLIDAPMSWITNRGLFLFVTALVIAWRIIPFSAIVILSNLQSIPKNYYEAFKLDGASAFDTLRYMTLPLIVPSLGVVLINLTTTAINVFDEVIALSGYQYENQTLLVYNYSNTFSFLDFGLGSSISYIIMAIAGIFGYFYVRNMTVEKVYER